MVQLNRLPILIVALVFGLTACGGGGSDNGPDTSAAAGGVKIVVEPQTRITSGDFYDYTPEVTGSSGALQFDGINLPEWMRINRATGNLFGTPGFDELGMYRNIQVQVSEGNRTAISEPFDIEVSSPPFNRENLETSGTVIETGSGFQMQGDLSMRFGEDEGEPKTYEDSDLQLELDEDGNLLDLVGEGVLPGVISENVTIDTGVRATFGLFTGEEINADDEFGVTLLDDRQYLLYFLDYGTDLVIQNPLFAGQVIKISAPPIPRLPKFILIEDPYDPMVYYGDGGDFALGFSLQGLIPYRPNLDHPKLANFEGHGIAKGAVTVGYKVMDFLKFSGELVVLDPTYSSVFEAFNGNLDPDPSVLDFKLGFNGKSEFELSILSVDLFTFEIGESSASMEAGFEGLALTIDGIIEPDVSWAPFWMPFVPDSQITADFYVNERGELDANLTGAYRSTLPEADVEGSIHMTLEEVTMQAVVRDRIDIPMSIVFGNNETHAEIQLNVSFEEEIDAAVSGAFDRAENRVHQTIADLEAATADYEFEVSLGGVRDGIPTLADAVISKLKAIPQTVRNAVDSAVVSKIKNKCVVSTPLGCASHASDFVNETAIGDQAGNDAKAEAQQEVDTFVAVFEELKFRVLQADDEQLREALEQALRSAYNHRTITETISGSRSISPYGTVSYSYTINEKVLSDSNANLILAAADNASRIQQSSDIMISSQELFDSLPTTEAIANVREKVESGATQVPGVESASYHVVSGNYSARVNLDDGSSHEVEFNMLSLDEAIAGISDLLATYVIEKDTES